MTRLSARRTTVQITHRLTAAAEADRIVVLSAGRLVEHGRHDELVAAGGDYARMWEASTGGLFPTLRPSAGGEVRTATR